MCVGPAAGGGGGGGEGGGAHGGEGGEEGGEGGEEGEEEWQWSSELDLSDAQLGRRQLVVLQSDSGSLLLLACELYIGEDGVR